MTTFVKELEVDKLAVIGDIHGMYDKFDSLLTKLEDDYPNHTVVLAGDLCDRGPNSKEVLDRCIEENILSVLGNHDQWFMDVVNPDSDDTLRYRSISNWTYGCNGGIQTMINLFGKLGEISFYDLLTKFRDPELYKYYEYFDTLPIVYDTPYGYIIHGGIGRHLSARVSSGNTIQDYLDNGLTVEDCIWGRMDWSPDGWASLDKTQIVGHSYPREGQDLIWSNTVVTTDSGCGCVEDAPLTAAVFPENKFVQV